MPAPLETDPTTSSHDSAPSPVMSPIPTKSNHRMHLRLDLRWLVFILLLVIVGMLAAWRPWQHRLSADSRTISVTGEATIQAAADNFVFYPSYNFTNSDHDAALKAMAAKSDDVVSKLKALGVSDNNIKTNANGYDQGLAYPVATPAGGGGTSAYTLQLTVTTTSRDQAQKVQDYLAGTSPSGAITPVPTFSEQKRKTLEGQARDQATKDARSKADQSAQNLGFKVGAVKSVSDGSSAGGGVVEPLSFDSGQAISGSAGSSKIAVQPGQNPLNYSVTVVYYLK